MSVEQLPPRVSGDTSANSQFTWLPAAPTTWTTDQDPARRHTRVCHCKQLSHERWVESVGARDVNMSEDEFWPSPEIHCLFVPLYHFFVAYSNFSTEIIVDFVLLIYSLIIIIALECKGAIVHKKVLFCPAEHSFIQPPAHQGPVKDRQPITLTFTPAGVNSHAHGGPDGSRQLRFWKLTLLKRSLKHGGRKTNTRPSGWGTIRNACLQTTTNTTTTPRLHSPITTFSSVGFTDVTSLSLVASRLFCGSSSFLSSGSCWQWADLVAAVTPMTSSSFSAHLVHEKSQSRWIYLLSKQGSVDQESSLCLQFWWISVPPIGPEDELQQFSQMYVENGGKTEGPITLSILMEV